MTIEIEAVLQTIEFGLPQIKLYLLIHTINYNIISHILAVSFIGVEPSWTCGEKIDLAEKCLSYIQGECRPHYMENITTIVTEVGELNLLLKYSIYYLY